ncbi:MAG: replicative DNA helicase, partial [Eubacterium sp.]
MAETNMSIGNMPFNLEAEQSVLGCILSNADCIEEAVKEINAECFYLPQHRAIFSAMYLMFSKSKTIDPVVLVDTLTKTGKYDTAGGREYLIQLQQSVPSTVNLGEYIKIVKEQYYLRTLIEISNEIIGQATSGEADASVIIDNAGQLIYNLNQGKDKDGPTKISEIIVNDVYTKLTQITGEDKEKYKGIPSGFGMLDKYLNGLNRSDLILIGARPAMGKTSFALNLAQNISMNARKKCVFFSHEMTKEQLAERLLSAQAGVESQKLKTGELTNDEWVRLGNAAGQFNDVELYLDDSSAITVPEIKARIRSMKDVDAVIIDYLGLITSASKKENRVQEDSEITRQLKMMAKDLDIPVIC